MTHYTIRLRVTVDADEPPDLLAKTMAVELSGYDGVVDTHVAKPVEWKSGQPGRPPTDRERARKWLRWWLQKRVHPVPAAEVFAAAVKAGISQRTLRRAADELHVVKEPPVGPQTAWSLPRVSQ